MNGNLLGPTRENSECFKFSHLSSATFIILITKFFMKMIFQPQLYTPLSSLSAPRLSPRTGADEIRPL